MHLIYSALRDLDNIADQHQSKDNSEICLRYQAYTEACQKHKRYLADIRKYFPGWVPPFR